MEGVNVRKNENYDLPWWSFSIIEWIKKKKTLKTWLFFKFLSLLKLDCEDRYHLNIDDNNFHSIICDLEPTI